MRSRKELVEVVLASPAMQACSPGDRHRVREYANAIIEKEWAVGSRSKRRYDRLVGVGFSIGGLAIFVAYWRMDLSMHHTTFGWQTVIVPLLFVLYICLIVASIQLDLGDDDGPGELHAKTVDDVEPDMFSTIRQIFPRVAKRLTLLVVVIGGGIGLNAVTPGGLLAVVLLALLIPPSW